MDDIFLIHMFEIPNRSEIKTWFRTADQMNEFLCGTQFAYAHEFGQIRDHIGSIVIGKWVIAQIE